MFGDLPQRLAGAPVQHEHEALLGHLGEGRNFRAALRARYSPDDWLKILQPINDRLRKRQRDALVAHILHDLRGRPDAAHINTPEKLFEYFLMDVQMEPCMLTSRVRHALSSVQIFTERCLMNLEPRVAASSLRSKHWEWMKRYRVWEANRKVFLYPENYTCKRHPFRKVHIEFDDTISKFFAF